jgi:hypothetical protein
MIKVEETSIVGDLGSKNLCWTSTLNPKKMEELILTVGVLKFH